MYFQYQTNTPVNFLDIHFHYHRANLARDCFNNPVADSIAKSQAAFELYILHDRGWGVVQNQNLALQYLQSSAQLGNTDAIRELERLHAEKVAVSNRLRLQLC